MTELERLGGALIGFALGEVASGALLGLGGVSLTKRRARRAERLAQKTMPRARTPIARMREAEAR